MADTGEPETDYACEMLNGGPERGTRPGVLFKTDKVEDCQLWSHSTKELG